MQCTKSFHDVNCNRKLHARIQFGNSALYPLKHRGKSALPWSAPPGDHSPLYRQTKIFAREGIELDRSTLADWVGSASQLLAPLVDEIRKHGIAASKIHADDTPVPVLAPGNGQTSTGRLWTYVRDDQPVGCTIPPAVWFTYSGDPKGKHSRRHLNDFKGALQADAYAGFLAA